MCITALHKSLVTRTSVCHVHRRAADGDTSLRCFTDPHAAADYCLQLACQQAGGPGQLTPAQHLQGRAADYDCENQTVLALLAAGLPLSFSPHLDRTCGWDAAVLDERGIDLGAAVRAARDAMLSGSAKSGF